MDHKTAERTLAVEKYLLDEFSPEEKDAFEDHFFSCDECAREIQLGAAFMVHAKESLMSVPAAAAAVVPVKKEKRRWFNWLSPAFAIPAMALLLGVVAFQNLVQFPAMHQELIALNAPAVLPNVVLRNSRGAENVLLAKVGDAFQLTLDVPDTAQTADLLDGSGRKLWTLAIPADPSRSDLALKMPGDLAAGMYTLVLRSNGVSAAGTAVSRYSFELKRS
jgi:anti-sigma factor RsiW